MNPKLTADRLRRRGLVYVRQSSPGQVVHNQESQRRQYGLADHARQLGFQDVVVIDEDLGRSGSGLMERPDSSDWWRKSVRERWARSSVSKRRAWHGTAAIGTT